MQFVHFICEHGSYDCMSKVIVAGIARKIGVQVLNGVICVILRWDFGIVPIRECLIIAFRTITGDLRGRKHRPGRQ